MRNLTFLLVLLAILLFSGVLSFLSLQEGHNWGDDFALYINQAKALVEGSVNRCYEENIFAMNNSSYPIGPHVYPWGFPLLLAPFYAIFGLNLTAFKIAGIIFFLLSLVLIFFLFKNRSSSNAIIIAGIMGFNPYLLSFHDNILSDIPFLFFTLLSLFLIFKVVIASKREYQHYFWFILTGLIIFFSFYIRSNGIALIFVLVISQIIEGLKNENGSIKLFILKLTIPCITFIAMYAIFSALLPSGDTSHLSFLQKINSDLIRFNIEYYFKELPKDFFGHFRTLNLYKVTIPFALLGAGLTLTKDYFLHLFFTIILSIYIIWPETQGLRFIFPIIPVYLYFTFSGISFINYKIKFYSKYNWLSILTGIILIFIFLNKVTPTILQKYAGERKVLEGPFELESNEAFGYLKNNSNKKEIIVFFKPRALNLLISRKSVMMNDFEKIEFINPSYLVIHKFMGDYNQVRAYDQRLIAAQWLKPVFENSHYIIYKNLQMH